jgi:hypothetical protein
MPVIEIEADVSMMEEEAKLDSYTRLLVSPVAMIVNGVLANATPPMLPESVPVKVNVIGVAVRQVTVRNASTKILWSDIAKKPLVHYCTRVAAHRVIVLARGAGPGAFRTGCGVDEAKGRAIVRSTPA